jgi:hypothetical protein
VSRKIPPDAFDLYFGLGVRRTYQAVAEHYDVSRRAVTALAVREGWRQKMVDLERKARERGDTKVVETLEAVQAKHLKTLQVVLGKALEALRAMPLTTAMDAVRAIEMVIKQERLVRGEPGDRSAIDVEAIIRREQESWLVPVKDERKGRDEAVA